MWNFNITNLDFSSLANKKLTPFPTTKHAIFTQETRRKTPNYNEHLNKILKKRPYSKGQPHVLWRSRRSYCVDVDEATNGDWSRGLRKRKRKG